MHPASARSLQPSCTPTLLVAMANAGVMSPSSEIIACMLSGLVIHQHGSNHMHDCMEDAQHQDAVYAGGTGYNNEQYVEYDLDNDDEDWLDEFNKSDNRLSDAKFETMLWRLELACQAAIERHYISTGNDY